jgi:K+-sensing histidine kinase KdpD
VEQNQLTPTDQQTLAKNLAAARAAHAQVEILHGHDPVAAILRFAHNEGITQLFIGHSQRSGWLQHFRPNPVERLILEAGGIDVRIFPNQPPTP